MNRPAINVAIEALVIGVMNATLIYGINKVDPNLESPILHLIAGALIHIIFEYTGGNKWWCKTTY
jgi:hypothetical protein